MRMMLAMVLTLALSPMAAVAQTTPPAAKPPMVGDKPLVQVTPKAPKVQHASGKPQSLAVRLQACLEWEDGTKGRLDCYDAVLPPKPNPKAPKAKGVAECRFTKEEDDRLTCYNGFVEMIPKLPTT